MIRSDSTFNETGIDCERLSKSRYGLIEVVDGQLVGIKFRYWPKTASRFGVWWSELIGRHRSERQDRCLLYYNEPRSCPGFLTLPFIESGRQATIRTVFSAMDALDDVARMKNCRAIVCEAANPRISDRLLVRRGYERQMLQAKGRHFIKRFES